MRRGQFGNFLLDLLFWLLILGVAVFLIYNLITKGGAWIFGIGGVATT